MSFKAKSKKPFIILKNEESGSAFYANVILSIICCGV